MNGFGILEGVDGQRRTLMSTLFIGSRYGVGTIGIGGQYGSILGVWRPGGDRMRLTGGSGGLNLKKEVKKINILKPSS